MTENKCISTVTITLIDYENMKIEINNLKVRLQEKTIIEYHSRWRDYGEFSIFIIFSAFMGGVFAAIIKLSNF